MNERIKEFAKQAMSLVMNGKDPDGDVKRMYIPNCFADKFAELVRADEREACAKEADKWSKRDDDVGAFIGQAIRARGSEDGLR
jgi:hypothetical protein